MFAQRADEIIRESISFINESADLADESFPAGSFRLRFYIVLIVGVGHGLLVGNNTRFGHGTDEHAMGIKIDVVLYLEGEEGIDVLGKEDKSVIGIQFVYPSNLSTARPVWNPKRLNTSKGASTDRQFTFITPVCLMTWWE